MTLQSITSGAAPMMAMFCTWPFQNPHTQNFLLLSLAGNSSAYRLSLRKAGKSRGDALLYDRSLDSANASAKMMFPV
jgi:hypothetical protein